MVTFGIKLVLMDRFNPFKFLELIHRYKITCFHIVPAMYNAILTLKQIENFDLSVRLDLSNKRMKIPIVLRVNKVSRVTQAIDYDILEEDENIKKCIKSKRKKWKTKR